MLNSVVYKGTSGWRQLSFPTKLALVMLYTVVMPLCMVGYMLTPANCLTKKLETPLFKLMSQASSVLWFLVLVAMSAFEDEYESLLQLSPLSMLTLMLCLFLRFSRLLFLNKAFAATSYNTVRWLP